MNSRPDSEKDAPQPGRFATTHWSVVLAAGREASPVARDALAALCENYWFPLYAYVRRLGYSSHDAQDLTQAFFARLLEKDCLADVSRSKGRFRSFLLASMKHFLANEWDRARAQKRGGGELLIRLDAHTAESRYSLEPVHDASPDKLFERRWALTLLERVLARLRTELEEAGKARVFERLKRFMAGEGGEDSYAAAGAELGLSEGNVKVTVHRLRKRYRQLLREEIAPTVSSQAEAREEIRCLFRALV